MSPTRTILRFNLALDRILSAIVQLRASVVTPLCCPPSLRLRVVPPVRCKSRRRRPRRLRANYRQVVKACAFASNLIFSRQYVVRTAFERANSELAQRLSAPSPSPSPAPSVDSVEFVMDTHPTTPPPPPIITPVPIRRPTLPTFPPSPPPLPLTRLTQRALTTPNSGFFLPIRAGSPIRAADQTFAPTPFTPVQFTPGYSPRRPRTRRPKPD